MVQEIKQPSAVFVVMSQAAKYYQLASKWGHATAMYNLGVFYVHGLGGVPVDCNRARELFVAAAEMGQINAQEALAMVPPANDTDSTGNSPCLLSS
jgi:TPR repeat protein